MFEPNISTYSCMIKPNVVGPTPQHRAFTGTKGRPFPGLTLCTTKNSSSHRIPTFAGPPIPAYESAEEADHQGDDHMVTTQYYKGQSTLVRTQQCERDCGKHIEWYRSDSMPRCPRHIPPSYLSQTGNSIPGAGRAKPLKKSILTWF